MPQATSFVEHSKVISQHFLQTVLAVDDNLVFERRGVTEAELDAFADETEPNDEEIALGTSVPDQQQPLEQKLYYQELSSSFASKGVVCSAFKPLDDFYESVTIINASSRNADITILDWQMDSGFNKANGDLAKASIKKILGDDEKEGGRLRLITIYTSEDELERIAADIASSLPRNYSASSNGCIVSFGDDNGSFTHTKVEVISKTTTEQELHSAVVNSFSRMTSGLLSNAALSAITDIRNNTHNFLHRFNKELDPAYLSHVIGLISSPDMREQSNLVAIDYAIDLLTEEFKSELQTSKLIKDALSKEALASWPSHVVEETTECFSIKVGQLDNVSFGAERMSNLLNASTNDELKQVLDVEPKIAVLENEESTKVFNRSHIQLSANGDKTAQHLELSAIQCVRRDCKTVGEHIPSLKLGTILKQGGNYYVCIQPLCDSVRLTNSTNFTFVRVKKVSQTSDKPFTHVVREQSNSIKLDIVPSSKDIYVFSFSPNTTDKVIKADTVQGVHQFKSNNPEKTFKWVGEFKQAISQDIANKTSASLSRVGFDSFEWLRLKANR